MEHGKLVQVGPPGEIYEQPNSKYVADFIGDINILEGRVVGRSGPTVEIETEAGRRLVVDSSEEVATGQTASIAVRPEKMRIDLDPPPAGAPNVIEGEIFDIGYLGDWTNFLINVPGIEGKHLRASRANMSRFVERPITWEDKVFVSFAPDAGVLLTR
jgi:putrescine transport system ATP-binding protein